jgi:hypothetical protein
LITADKLSLLTRIPAVMLTEAIRQQGYKNDKFETAVFLGLTNAGQFCYNVSYIEDSKILNTKVFVTYDSATESVTVDY